MKNEGGQKILASIGTPPGWDWDLVVFQNEKILKHFYDKCIDVWFDLQLKCTALAKKDLDPNQASIGTPPG